MDKPVYKPAISGSFSNTRMRPVHICHRQDGGETASRPQGSFSPILVFEIRQLTIAVTISPTVGTETDRQSRTERAKQGKERRCGRRQRETQCNRHTGPKEDSRTRDMAMLLHLSLGPPVGGVERGQG